ncbi:unnamed protein product, partial [marine sediment metagenome]
MGSNQILENENLKNKLFYACALAISWILPGHGEPYDTCGDFYSKGCLNSRDHQDKLIFIKRMVST